MQGWTCNGGKANMKDLELWLAERPRLYVMTFWLAQKKRGAGVFKYALTYINSPSLSIHTQAYRLSSG